MKTLLRILYPSEAVLWLVLLLHLPETSQAQPGSLDTTFHSPITGGIQVISVQSDQRILIAGDFTATSDGARINLARLHPDGSLDQTFKTAAGADGTIRALALQPDDKVIIGGEFTQLNGVSRNGIARVNVDGSLDESFVAGAVPTGAVRAIAVQSDGRVLVAGEIFSYTQMVHRVLVRLLPGGEEDASFLVHAEPVYADWAGVRALTFLPDGRIYVTGPFSSINGVDNYGLARLLADGTVDRTFRPSAYQGNTLALQPDGKLVVGGPFGIARVNPDGTRDGFEVGLESADDPELWGLIVQPDGRVLAAGAGLAFENSNTIESLLRVNPDGSADDTFHSAIQIGVGCCASALALQADGQILAGAQQVFRLNNQLITGIEFTSTSFTADEGTRRAHVTVHRTGPLGHLAAVRLAVQYGTATLGEDYSIPSRWIVFRRGEMTKTIDVFIRQDLIAEGPETVSLSLSDPLRAELALRTVALLTINDDDAPPGD